jgi:hypothetical protein
LPAWAGDPLDDHFASPDPVPEWPPVPILAAFGWAGATATGPPGPGDAGGGQGACGPGSGAGWPGESWLLRLTIPWATLCGPSEGPGLLSRIGPITAVQARHLAGLAVADPEARWSVLITDHDGEAVAVASVPRRRQRGRPGYGPGGAGQLSARGLIGRVTVTIPAAQLAALENAAAGDHSGPGMRAALVRAALRAWASARERADADRDAPGGCAHGAATKVYRPPPRISELVRVRDQTCRYPYCGRPAWCGDLDHTQPHDQGGPTCLCNLGALCRMHHRLKQRAGWSLVQPRAGVFAWTTPAGRSYSVTPDVYPS